LKASRHRLRRLLEVLHAGGLLLSNQRHVATGSIAMLKARTRMSGVLRTLPGSSLVVAPSDRDLAAPDVAAGLEESFSGGRLRCTAAPDIRRQSV